MIRPDRAKKLDHSNLWDESEWDTDPPMATTLGNTNYDYIIVGGGSAGCVLANRLSADATCRVLLLEAGPMDWHPAIRVPIGEILTVGSTLDWNFSTDSEPGLANRIIKAPRGKVLGGSSAINGQLYTRGHPSDYDNWARQGCSGWGWSDVLPYFRRSETWAGGETQLRGSSGPLSTIHGRYRAPIYQAFLDAGVTLGHKVLDDYNSEIPEGFAWAQYTQDHRRARRCSAAHGYLRPVLSRSNLCVHTGSHALGLILERGRCTGVRYDRSGTTHVAGAGEVILTAGAYQSPQLLMLSGIGPADHLTQIGIKVRHDLSGVGKNLQDHGGGVVQYRCPEPATYFSLRNPVRLSWAIAELIFFNRGPLSVFPSNCIAFMSSAIDEERPDLQFYLFAAAVDCPERRTKFAAFSGFAITWSVMRPRSRGQVTLRSDSPWNAPRIRHNYLTDSADIAKNNRALSMAREIAEQPPMSRFRSAEVHPGPNVRGERAICAYNQRVFASHFHAVGSCHMGIDDAAVVDPNLRVRGIENLRVADASVMPTIPSGNTNAPTIMIAERAADLIVTGAS